MVLTTWWHIFLVPVVLAQQLYIQEIKPQNMSRLRLQVNATLEVVLMYRDLPELNVSKILFSTSLYPIFGNEFLVSILSSFFIYEAKDS